MKKTVFDVAIVGSGPAGSSAAVALSQKGWRVLLLEQDTYPRHKVCGEFLSPEAQRSLRSLGVYENAAMLLPVSLHHAVVTSPRGQEVHVELPVSAWGISRFALDDMMATASREHGATVWTGVAVSNYSESDDGYQLTLDHGVNSTAPRLPGTVSAQTMILACGRHSRLTAEIANSRVTGRHRRSQRQRYVGVKCHFEGAVASDEIELFFISGGYGGINSVEKRAG